MFVLLFAFVFGGAIPIPGGGSYREFLMPGIFVQTLAFASITTAIAVADDMTKGLIDRFRSLPMARSAVLSGRTFADILYNAGILVVLMLTGLVVGWRVNSGLGDFVAAVALLLFFTYAMAWIGRLPRPRRPDGRGRAAARLPRHLPDHVRLERVRADGDAAGLRCSRSPSGTRSAR